jgi:phosphoribosylaminoimidazole-succinocarboxamide synthase
MLNESEILTGNNRTPDSSRFWPAPVNVGVEQPSFDKQYLRDYLTSNGLKGKAGVSPLERLLALLLPLWTLTCVY